MKAQTFQVVLLFRQQVANSSAAESYHIEVVRAPGRGWGGPFIPLGVDETQILTIRRLYRGYIERQLAMSQGSLGERDLEPLRVVGRQLFNILPESVQARLHHAQAVAQEKGKGLAITLAFEMTAQPLLSLPWELLYNPEGRYFFGLRGGGITRQLWLPVAPRRAVVASSQKSLGLWAEPGGVNSLSARRGYHPSPDYDDGFTWITGQDSMGQLTRALESKNYDGLHIVAHGRLGSSWHDFVLVLVDERGQPDWVSPDQLAVLLADYPGLGFVYLDVCASAEPGYQDDETRSPLDYSWRNLASDLLGHGIPAVVAMQDSISQDAAGLFAQTFYAERANSATLSQALTRARREVRLQLDDPVHWSIPTLYSQTSPSQKGNIFTQIADFLLDHLAAVLQPGLLLVLSAVILANQLAKYLARSAIATIDSWLTLVPPVVLSVLLVLLGALSMRGGYQRLRDLFGTDKRQWLRILLRKYTAASVFGFLWWLVIWVAWLLLTWFEPVDVLDVTVRTGMWSLFLLGIYAAGFVGARQSIRQSILFLHERDTGATLGDWFLFLAIPFIPVMFAWIFVSAWPFLTSDLAVFLGVMALMAVYTTLTRRGNG